MMDKNFSIQPREPLLEKQFPRPLGTNYKKNPLDQLVCCSSQWHGTNNQTSLHHEVSPTYSVNIIEYNLAAVVKGGCENGWSEDQFERDCEPVGIHCSLIRGKGS